MSRICMVVHKYYDHDSRVRRYAETLAAAGEQIDILCLLAPGKALYSDRGAIRVFCIPFSRSLRRSQSYLLEYGAALLLYTSWLLVLFFKQRYAIIHVHNMPDFLTFTALVPRMLGAKVILDVHDPMPEFYMSKYAVPYETAMVRYMQIQEQLSARLAHAVIAANPNFKANLVRRGIPCEKITVVSNIPDPQLFDRNRYSRERHRRSDDFTLIYPGTIAPRYGLHVAIRALPLLIPKIPRLRLLIIGPQGAYADELAALAEELGLSSHVQIKPLIPVNEVPLAMVQADVGIYPAIPDPHMSIATPSKVLEFAMMGRPIIASRLKILENLFGERAILFFEPENSAQFAERVLALYQNPALAERCVQEADAIFTRSQTWANECRAYFDVLNGLAPSEQIAAVPSQDLYPAEALHAGPQALAMATKEVGR